MPLICSLGVFAVELPLPLPDPALPGPPDPVLPDPVPPPLLTLLPPPATPLIFASSERVLDKGIVE